jgi:hypothetical protein
VPAVLNVFVKVNVVDVTVAEAVHAAGWLVLVTL